MLSDAYVRSVFRLAIDDVALNIKGVIDTRTEKDKGHEEDLVKVGTNTATNLAAKEAMVDRNRSFWQSSRWAKRLSDSVVSVVFVCSL